MVWGAIIGAVGSYLAARKQSKAMKDAANAAKFTPYNISSLLGDVSITGNKLNITPTGFLNNFLRTSVNKANKIDNVGLGFINQLNKFDPFEAAQTQFNRLEEILQPERDSARQQLQNKLLSQGRLGSISTNLEGDIIGGGAADQLALEQAIERERQRNLINQFSLAQDTMKNLYGLGTGLLSSGLAQRAFAIDVGKASLLPANLSMRLGTAGANAGANVASILGRRAALDAGFLSSAASGIGKAIDAYMNRNN